MEACGSRKVLSSQVAVQEVRVGLLSLTSKPQSSFDCLWEWFLGWAPGSWVHMASGVFIDSDSDSSSRASMSGPEAWGLPLGWPSAASSHVGATLCPGWVPPQPLWAPRQGQTDTRPPVHWGGPAQAFTLARGLLESHPPSSPGL